MRPADVARALSAIIPTRQSALLLGPPGLGKSSLAYQAGSVIHNGEDFHSTVTGLPDVPWLVTIRALDRDPVDLRGLPFVKDGKTRWSEPELMSQLRPEGGIILIEELPQALPAVQCVLRELLLDHRIGGHRIPEKWTVVATGNRAADRAGAAKLLSHVASSVVVMELEPSLDDWQAWAIKASVPADVRSFLNFKPTALHDFDPARLVNTDPRGWERVGILSGGLEKAGADDLMLSVLSGAVTNGHAAEFIAFRKLFKQLPDPKAVLASPDTSSVPTDPAVLYALSGALVEAIRGKTGEKLLPGFAKYVSRMPHVFGILTFLDGIKVQPQKLVTLKEAQKFVAENRDLILVKK